MNEAVMSDHDSYAGVRRARDELAQLIARAHGVAGTLELAHRATELGTLRSRIEDDTYQVLMVGEQKRGKSTLLNAMLGAQVLPARARPTTGMLISVAWDENKRVVLGRDGSDEEVTLPIEGDTIPPGSELWNALTIRRDDSQAPSPYNRAVVNWPTELCRQGVVLIDSPGLNEAQARDEITLKAVRSADVAVFVVSTAVSVGLSESRYVDTHLRPYGHEELFVVCTNIDKVPPEERDDTTQDLADQLRRVLGARADRIFFVNSRAALDLRMANGNAGDAGGELLAESGIPAFEAALEEYLAKGRAAVKVCAPARELARVVPALRSEVAMRQGLLDTKLEVLRARWEGEQESLRQLEQERDQIRDRIETALADIKLRVQASARTFLLRTADESTGWLEAMDPENKVGLSPFKVKEQLGAAVEELSEEMSRRLEGNVALWQTKELKPELDEALAELGTRLDKDFQDFTARADQVRLRLTARSGTVTVDEAAPSTAERVIGTVASVAAFGPGAGLMGARFGFKGALRALAPQIAIGVGILALGGGPIAFFGAQLLTSLIGTQISLNKVNRVLKEKVTSQVADHLRTHADAEAERIAHAVKSELVGVRDTACRALDAEIETIRHQVRTTLAKKTAQQGDTSEKRAELARLDHELDSVANAAAAISRRYA
ncbi:dynamin family protein [Streptomyces sp. ActVer]|uniref:dynamin family protein n=1 Tax=Streptomyces sp. ActVer TaxID=3014558 RepID=UPI0022B321F3|nr:dynamin family protein [Streptomyces sp. ActVer]MCZ4510742.1 dynamin family protein [Streptomyces sp. ActVer]